MRPSTTRSAPAEPSSSVDNSRRPFTAPRTSCPPRTPRHPTPTVPEAPQIPSTPLSRLHQSPTITNHQAPQSPSVTTLSDSPSTTDQPHPPVIPSRTPPRASTPPARPLTTPSPTTEQTTHLRPTSHTHHTKTGAPTPLPPSQAPPQPVAITARQTHHTLGQPPPSSGGVPRSSLVIHRFSTASISNLWITRGFFHSCAQRLESDLSGTGRSVMEAGRGGWSGECRNGGRGGDVLGVRGVGDGRKRDGRDEADFGWSRAEGYRVELG
ncbi:hypothetical protein SAMN04489732_11860 [Amycolatopsis saalfeldensis]|uniref:Uncharacterized protein n=1 Tax=Amycolatopsis saalfeldensis TaxID=394193 RepID=A0A1H8YII0_9PSEU|nr:hypothetical protein SAMN04489732_11860 [Amycolatopsis saalfeldensis]